MRTRHVLTGVINGVVGLYFMVTTHVEWPDPETGLAQPMERLDG